MKTILLLKSSNKRSIIFYTIFLQYIFKRLNKKCNLVYLPKKIKKITLLKSPHIYKKAREQFQSITYKRNLIFDINILENKLSFIKLLTVNKPANIKMLIKSIN